MSLLGVIGSIVSAVPVVGQYAGPIISSIANNQSSGNGGVNGGNINGLVQTTPPTPANNAVFIEQLLVFWQSIVSSGQTQNGITPVFAQSRLDKVLSDIARAKIEVIEGRPLSQYNEYNIMAANRIAAEKAAAPAINNALSFLGLGGSTVNPQTGQTVQNTAGHYIYVIAALIATLLGIIIYKMSAKKSYGR